MGNNRYLVSENLYNSLDKVVTSKREKEISGHVLYCDDNGVFQSFPTQRMVALWELRPDLQEAFPEIRGEDLKGYWGWWISQGALLFGVSNLLPEILYGEHIPKDNLLALLYDIVWSNNHVLQTKFSEPLQSDSDEFVSWWLDHGRREFFNEKYIKDDVQRDILDFNDKEAEEYISSLKLSSYDEPEVSLLIPVYDAFVELVECIASIIKHVNIKYEIIILDDCSPDKRIEKYFSSLEGIKYRRNLTNTGYLKNINTGIEYSRAEYIVFVNSDIQFMEDSITALINAMKNDNSVSISGPKLVYPNGVLQEAGCSVDSNCDARMIGVGGNIFDKRYCYNRYVDYVSGACLCIKKSDFISFDGFDESLAPAYTEDWDLCSRVLRKGKKVLYVADTFVMHHLSVSSDLMSPEYKYGLSAKNRMKIREKHGEYYKQYAKIKAIAFYLPQFHAVTENSYWWGEGYTEWTATAMAKPNYEGHYQPHVPADMGFYDLGCRSVIEKQSRLARRYGINGFCFYYYNFGHREILQEPLDLFLDSDAEIDFCVCWANENWTRTWDGEHKNILLEQHALNNDEFLSIIKGMERFLRDNRYIKVDGKPMILVYRAQMFDDMKLKTLLWREYWREKYGEELYLCVVDSMERVSGACENPEELGFDASVEFPVHFINTRKPLEESKKNSAEDFTGTLIDYTDAVAEILLRQHPEYKRFPCVFPSWDNTPRRGSESIVFDDPHPSVFQRYVEIKAEEARLHSGDERMLFVNAWNEWGEGAHLEPDMRYGHTWLEVVNKVLKEY